MAAGTSPPRVMQTMASNGPLSASRQASARASRWNWSQETGKDLRELGWTMVHPNARSRAAAALPHFGGQINPPTAERADSADPIARLLPKSHASRHSAQKALSEEAAAADKTVASAVRRAAWPSRDRQAHEGSVHDPSIPSSQRAACAGLCAGHPGRHRGRHAGADAREVHPRLALRGPGRAVHGGARQGLLQSRGPRRHASTPATARASRSPASPPAPTTSAPAT